MKNKYTEKDFIELIDGETIAYYCYDLLIRKKLDDEYVDIIANTYCSYNRDLKPHLPAFYRAKLVLEKDYNVNMYELPFKFEKLKDEIRRYELIKELENYFEEKNILYKKDKVYFKYQELSSLDPNIEKIMDEINDIDMNLINTDKTNINI